MVFVSNSQGTLTKVISSPIYQGSSLANEIVLLAPFPASNAVTVGFTLPNGIPLESKIMTPVSLRDIDVANEVGQGYNAWVLTMEAPATEFVGLVSVYFTIYAGFVSVGGALKPSYLTTSASSFEVTQGGYPDNTPTLDDTTVWDEILAALSAIQGATANALDVSIKRVVYKANTLTTPTSLIGQSDGGTFTIASMQSFKNDLNVSDYWFKGTNVSLNFDPFNMGLVQLYVFGNTEDVTANLYVDGVQADSVTINAVETGYISVIRLYANKEVNEYISLSFSGDIYIKAIEVFAQTLDGAIDIIQNNGAVSTIPTFDANIVVQTVEDAYALYNLLMTNQNQAGGVVVVGADGKIPSTVIPNIVKTNYFEVASESDLVTLSQAEIGDIGYIEDTSTDPVTLQFYILLGTGDYSIASNWVEYNPSTAGSALFANQARTAQTAERIGGTIVNGNVTGGVIIKGTYTDAQYQDIVDSNQFIQDAIYIVEV